MSRDLKRLGPKAWRPLGIWPESSLLSLEEKLKAAKIERQAKAWGRPPSQEDTLWLCALARRLAAISPDDYAFPEFLALVNQKIGSTFALRFLKTVPMRGTAPVSEFIHTRLFETVTSNDVSDATAVVRPYARIHEGASLEVIERIRAFSVRLVIDDIVVLEDPLEEHLIGPDGRPFRKNLFKFKSSNINNQFLFPAVQLQRNPQGTVEAVFSLCEGIFCPKDTRISLDVYGKEFQGPVTLTGGLVAALYTTKSVSGEISYPYPRPIL